MTGAMYAAIGGLRTHMSNMNVIGNNIANVNTQSYKAQRMTFEESMYVTSRAGSNGTASTGGNNPSQVGYGSTVGSIDLNMSPGTFSPTGYDLDCMIDGEGFFLVGDKETGDGVKSYADLSTFDLTRKGDFWVDPNGYVCDRHGKCVYGYSMVQNPNFDPSQAEDPKTNPRTIVSTTLVPLRLPLSAIKDPTGQDRWREGDAVYNVLDTPNVDDNNSRTNYSLGDVTAAVKQYIADHYSGTETEEIPTAYYYTKADGVYQTGEGVEDATDGAEVIVTIDPETKQVTSISYGRGSKNVGGVAPNFGPEDEVNFGDAAVGYEGIGRPIPNSEDKCVQLFDMAINKNGAIIGTTENGQTITVGYVAVVNAAANDGVTHIGGPYYKAQEGAGDLRVSVLGGVAVDAKGNPLYMNNKQNTDRMGDPPVMDAIQGGGKNEIRNGGLEMSTADVANEFASMILTQRGYQANTRMVTVTDSMLEELVNMKR